MSVPLNGLMFVPRGGALFTESSFLFLSWGSQWLQAKEPVGPVVRSMAMVGPVAVSGPTGGIGGTRGRLAWPLVLDLWLLVCPEAVGGTLVMGVACGCRWARSCCGAVVGVA